MAGKLERRLRAQYSRRRNAKELARKGGEVDQEVQARLEVAQSSINHLQNIQQDRKNRKLLMILES